MMTTTTRLYKDDLMPNDESTLTKVPGQGIGVNETGAYDQGIFAPQDVGLDPVKATTPTAAGTTKPEVNQGVMGHIQRAIWGYSDADMQAQAKERRDRVMKIREFKAASDAMEDGFKIADKLTGAERDKFVDSYAPTLDKAHPGVGEAFRTLAKAPDYMAMVREYAQNSPTLQESIKADPSGKEAWKLIQSPSSRATIFKEIEVAGLPRLTQKIRTMTMGWQQLVPKEMLDQFNEDGVITHSELMKANEHIANHPEEKYRKLALTPADQAILTRNEEAVLGPLGILTGKKEEEAMAQRVKSFDKNAAPQTKEVDGKVYQWDPQKKLKGTRLGTDDRYVLLGRGGTADADKRRTVDLELKMSDDYNRETKKFSDLRGQFDTATEYMANRATEKTSAGDAALMYAYAKIRDPNDRLAVSETRDLAKLGNIFQRIGASVESVLDKGQVLDDKVASAMYEEIKRRFMNLNKGQIEVERDYERRAKEYGLNPDNVRRVKSIKEPGGAAEPSQADLEFTAKQHGITVEEVKRRLKARKGG